MIYYALYKFMLLHLYQTFSYINSCNWYKLHVIYIGNVISVAHKKIYILKTKTVKNDKKIHFWGIYWTLLFLSCWNKKMTTLPLARILTNHWPERNHNSRFYNHNLTIDKSGLVFTNPFSYSNRYSDSKVAIWSVAAFTLANQMTSFESE